MTCQKPFDTLLKRGNGTTRQKPNDNFPLACGRGSKQSFNNNKRKLKITRQRQLLTGDHLVNETREVREADSTDARPCSTSVYRIIIRTAEVTIGIILERTARSLSTFTADLETELSITTSMVPLLKASSVLLMVVRFDIRTELIHVQFVFCNRHRTWVSRSRAPASCRYCKLVCPQWGSCQPSLTTMTPGVHNLHDPNFRTEHPVAGLLTTSTHSTDLY